MDSGLHSVINIRVKLENYTVAKSLQKMYRRNTQKFRCEINEVRIDSTKEEFYERHKTRFQGAIMPTLENTLFGFEGRMYCPFHTHELCVYDGEKLVAVSYFDIGNQSVASILGLFSPDYNKYSLGMFTMLLEIDLALRLGKKFYYPGHILHGNTSFDYKLRLGNIQYHDGRNYWKPYQEIYKEKWLDKQIDSKVHKLEQFLQEYKIAFKTLLNPYFQLSYIAFVDKFFLESPIHIICFESQDNASLVLEYLPDSQKYRLSTAEKIDIMPEMQPIIESLGAYNPEIYNKDLLVYKTTIAESYQAEEIVTTLVMEKILRGW